MMIELQTRGGRKYRATVGRMIETTTRTVSTKPCPQIVDAIGLIRPLRVRFSTSQFQPPHMLCNTQKPTKLTIRIPASGRHKKKKKTVATGKKRGSQTEKGRNAEPNETASLTFEAGLGAGIGPRLLAGCAVRLHRTGG